VDDVREPAHVYPENRNWLIAKNVQTAKLWLAKGIVRHLSLDHDLGTPETGYDLMKWIAANNYWPAGQILVHSANPIGRENIQSVINNRERIQKILGGSK
jgi:hypothetical protein